jgi:uncharacterized FAD-dependent dehydrogenase
MKKVETVEAEVIDNKILKDFDGKNRLQYLEVLLSDGRIYKEYYSKPNKKVLVGVDDKVFDIGKKIEVVLSVGFHSKEHVYNNSAANIEKIVVPIP